VDLFAQERPHLGPLNPNPYDLARVSVHGDNPAIIQVGATYTDLGASNKIPVEIK
jgi:hypothetical protein